MKGWDFVTLQFSPRGVRVTEAVRYSGPHDGLAVIREFEAFIGKWRNVGVLVDG